MQQGGDCDEPSGTPEALSPLASTVFRLRQGCSTERLPDGTVLFSEAQQQLHALNESSALLATCLFGGATRSALAGALQPLGVDEGERTEWVTSFLREMSRLGLLEAQSVAATDGEQCEQRIALAGLTFSIRYSSADVFGLIGPLFAHLQSADREPDFTYHASAADGFILIGNQAQRGAAVEPELAAVWLKGAILEETLASADHLFALHAACLRTPAGAVLLLGAPGAGKTTLSLKLLQAGCGISSDDVTLVHAGGEVSGVPLAPAIKESGWEFLRSCVADLEQLHVHCRPDGQQVRFLPLDDRVDSTRTAVSMVVSLRRSETGYALLKPMAAQQAVAELMHEARSPDGQCSPEIIHALAEIVRGAKCVELHYSDAADACAILIGNDSNA